MPTVRKYGAPKVERQITPSPRLSIDSGGAFAAPKPIDTSAVTKLAADIYEQEQERADQVAITDATARLTAAETRILYGPTGLLNREQEDALKAPDEFGPAWQAEVSAIENGLKNDRQRHAFNQQVIQRSASANRQLQQHVASESQKFDIAKTENLVDNEQNAAIENYTDPARVKLALETQVAAITAFGDRHGAPAEKIEAMVSAALSSTHVGIINRMLANGKDLTASEYYKANKDQVAGNQVAQVEKNLEEGSLRGEAQRVGDSIWKKYGSDQAAADEAVRAIKDPKLRDEVQKNVDYEFSKARQRKKAVQDDYFERAAQIVDARPGIDPRKSVPVPLWNALSLEDKAALRRYADAAGGGSGPSGVTSDAKWLDFLSLSPTELKKLSRRELETGYLQYLGKRDRSRAITRWDVAVKGGGDPEDNEDLKSAYTFAQQVTQALELSKLTGQAGKESNDEKRLKARAARRAEELRAQFAEAKGGQLTSTEERAIVDQVVLEEAFSAPGKKTITIKERGIAVGTVIKEDDGTVRVPYGRVPAAERASIESAIKRAGGRVTRDKVERAYAAGVMGDAAAARRIVQEK